MEDNLHQGAANKLFNYARANRKKQTPAEEVLWQHLRNRKLDNHKFRRQHPLGTFIADFYLHEFKLAIELDGAYHNEAEIKEYDAGWTYELAELGVKVLRFRNEEVLHNIGYVLETIRKHLTRNPTLPGEGLAFPVP